MVSISVFPGLKYLADVGPVISHTLFYRCGFPFFNETTVTGARGWVEVTDWKGK
jgi:hypothetical protein